MNLEQLAEEFGTPVYVYDAEKIKFQYALLQNSFTYPHTKFFYAVKANYNPEILKILQKQGAGVDTVSINELRLALKLGFAPEQIIFTPANVSLADMKFAVSKGVILNLGSLAELEILGQNFAGVKVSVRINPNVGGGHHVHTITGGPNSKFGIDYNQVGKIKSLIERYQLQLIGVHSHIGSGILNVETFLKAMDIVLDTAQNFNNLRFVDFGGGFGVPYKPSEQILNIKELGCKASDKFAEFSFDREIDLYFEPGRFLVAEAGVFLTRVNSVKKTPHGKNFVAVDSGFAQLARPMIYDAYHEIINISNPEGEIISSDIVGNICESGDIFGRERLLAEARSGDILAIMNVGAYGMSMVSNYNLQALPAEVLVEKKQVRLIRSRQKFSDIWQFFQQK